MIGGSAAATIKLKVFISYSRKDEEFAQELLAGLEAIGCEPYLDKRDIVVGEAWEARLGRLIEASDTVVFVISPDAVKSDRCTWEVDRTCELKKRLLPIVFRSVEAAQVPTRLKQLNYIYFDKPFSFGPSLAALAIALKTEISWVREHTRIGEAALRWDTRDRADALLYRGQELGAAKTWLSAQPIYAPEPTALQLSFIKTSEDAEAARSNAERQRLIETRAAFEREKVAHSERERALHQAQAALRKGQRAVAAAGISIALLVVGAFGWQQQAYLKEQYQWRIVMGPRPLTIKHMSDAAVNPGSSFKECLKYCPTMIVVPVGLFVLGSHEYENGRSPDEGPQQTIQIATQIAIGKYAVTFAEWDTCVEAGACPRNSDSGWGREDRPAINVSWYDAQAYAEWLSRVTGKKYRLLTEAEWEYSARAGTTSPYHFDNEDKIGKYAWFRDNSGGRSQPVGQKLPNAFGLFDMNGNVNQWVSDCYVANYSTQLSGGTTETPNCGRVIRGGSWISVPRVLRSASRGWITPVNRVNYLGFRVAMDMRLAP